ncbi:MAG: phage portal protein [Rhizobium sp.]|nr:phage portal protein [Rhizobium sp.]
MNFTGIVSSAKKALGLPVEQKAYSLTDPAIGELFGVIPTASGVVVTGNSAMHVPAVLQAVRLISETIGSLPCKLYREADDSKEAAKDHPGHKITHSRANDWTSAGQLRIDLTVDALLP